jgi:bifunctional hydroxylase/dehydrase
MSVQDATNLGWKLAATVRGWAPPDLLDTYHTERHTAGARLLMNTAAQAFLYLSGSEYEPLRDVFADLIHEFPEVDSHLAGMVSALDVQYDVGPGSHPLLGRRIPSQELVAADGGTTTIEQLHEGRGVLLDLADRADLREAAAPWSDRIRITTARPAGPSAAGSLARTAAVLVRHDGYVAWTDGSDGSDGTDGSDTDALTGALHRWFGEPLDQLANANA